MNSRLSLRAHQLPVTDAVVSPADPNLVQAAFTNTLPYREVQLNTFMEFSKYLRVSSKGILVSE